MKNYIFVLTLFVPTFAALVATDVSFAANSKAAERDVIVPDDTKPFTVRRNQIVRITGEGIGGGQITAKVVGPATILAENVISHVRGGDILIGADHRDFEIRPTGKGTVRVTITSIPPQPDAEPTVTSYQFRVK